MISLAAVLLPAWYFGYPIAMETLWRGRTLGKAALGLRVVTREGGQVRFRHAAIRALLGIVDFLSSYGAVAAICVAASRDNQRLGDMVAGTLGAARAHGARPTGRNSVPGAGRARGLCRRARRGRGHAGAVAADAEPATGFTAPG